MITSDYDDGGIKIWIDKVFRGKFTHEEARQIVQEFVFNYGVDVTHPKNTEQQVQADSSTPNSLT